MMGDVLVEVVGEDGENISSEILHNLENITSKQANSILETFSEVTFNYSSYSRLSICVPKGGKLEISAI